MPVSDDTKEMLEQVKKGKARKFVMLTKGANIVWLILFKKGNATKFVKQAKEQAKEEGSTGVPCYGVVGGKGMDINFQLAVSDGFDKKPVKDLVLKKFLEEEAEFKCQPMIEIVETSPIVLDADDPLHARFLKLQTAAQAACETHPAEAEKIGTLCRQTGAYLDSDQREPGESKLEELEDLLKSLAGSPASGEENKERQTYDALRVKLEPLLLAAQKAVPDKATAFGNVWNYAEAQAEKGNYAGANKGLVGLAEALKKTLSAPPQSDAEKFGIREGIVAEMVERFSQAVSLWDTALVQARSHIKPLQDELQATFPDTATELDNIVNSYWHDLFEVLTAAEAQERQEDLAAAVETALQQIQLLRAEVGEDLLLGYLEECGVEVKSTFNDAFAEVETQLKA